MRYHPLQLLAPFDTFFAVAGRPVTRTVVATRITTLVFSTANISASSAPLLARKYAVFSPSLGARGLGNKGEVTLAVRAVSTDPHLPAAASQSTATDTTTALLTSRTTIRLDVTPQRCMLLPQCREFFAFIQKCYDQTVRGPEMPPWMADDDFQRLFCNNSTHAYPNPALQQDCKACMFQSSAYAASRWLHLEDTISRFCGTSKPSVYLLMRAVIEYLSGLQLPGHEVITNITSITTWSKAFVSYPGIMRDSATWSSTTLTTTRTSRTTTMTDFFFTAKTSAFSNLPILTTTTLGATAIPQPSINPTLIAQLPPSWPYTAPGVARKPGKTASFTLTDVEEGHAVAVVVAEVRWYPRVLRGEQGELLRGYVMGV